MLADSVFCKASVPPTEKVCLWLGVSPHQTVPGCREPSDFTPVQAVTSIRLFVFYFPPSKANVMLEYDIDEAHALLEKNLQTASRNLETLNGDLDFLQNQITTTEVSILPPRLCLPLCAK